MEADLAILAQEPSRTARRATPRRGQTAHNPLWAPLGVFAAVAAMAAVYVAYTLWPRWPEAPVALDAPSLPIVISGVTFNIEPAAIRMAVQRHPGTHERVDLSYLWPSLAPPDPAIKSTVGAPLDPNERLFVTIASGDATLPLIERVQTIYPRPGGQGPADPGLVKRTHRNATPASPQERDSPCECRI